MAKFACLGMKENKKIYIHVFVDWKSIIYFSPMFCVYVKIKLKVFQLFKIKLSTVGVLSLFQTWGHNRFLTNLRAIKL
jgi:hypothetical protein